MDFVNAGDKTFAWLDDGGHCVDAQREFVYFLPPLTARSQVGISFRTLPPEIEIQAFKQGHSSREDAGF